MPLDAEARLVLDLMEQLGAPPFETLTPPEARAARADLAPPVIDPCHATEDLDAGGVPARLYRPTPSDTPPGLLVWLHGGGWVCLTVNVLNSSRADFAPHGASNHVGFRIARTAP